MALEVNVKTIPTRQVVSITRHVKVPKLEATIRESISAIRTLLQEQNGTAADSPFGIFHGSINEQEDGPIEICIPADGNLKSDGDVQVKQLEGGSSACVMMVGAQTDFPAILEGYDAVADWIQKNGYQMAERPREVWHSGPGEEPKMEIVWLFK